MHSYILGFKRALDFDGRSNRSEYWMFMLVNVLLVIGAHLLEYLLGLSHGPRGPISTLYALVVTLPSWAVTIRRLHDIGKSGWFGLVAFIPIIGAIVLLVWVARKSDPSPNAYG